MACRRHGRGARHVGSTAVGGVVAVESFRGARSTTARPPHACHQTVESSSSLVIAGVISARRASARVRDTAWRWSGGTGATCCANRAKRKQLPLTWTTRREIGEGAFTSFSSIESMTTYGHPDFQSLPAIATGCPYPCPVQGRHRKSTSDEQHCEYWTIGGATA